MNISGRTKIVGIFGYPVEHSLSPCMHNAAFRYLNIDFCYVPFLIKPESLPVAVNSIRALGISGVNVTIPHKEKVIAFLDDLSEEAKFIGSVNTITNSDGRLTGFNTDGKGFMSSLTEAGIDVSGKKILLLGAGGAARAVGYCLCKEVSHLFIYNRTAGRAESLKTHLFQLNKNVATVSEDSINNGLFIGDIDMIVNSTPLGMKSADPMPLDVSLLKADQVVCDLIYKDTPFIKAASELGCRTLNGLGMLLWQGVLAFEKWTGIKPPIEVMREALLGKI
jgi:shikimate dehydrogenase